MDTWLVENKDRRNPFGEYEVTEKNKIPLSPDEFVDWLVDHKGTTFNFLYGDKYEGSLLRLSVEGDRLYVYSNYFDVTEEIPVVERHDFQKYPIVRLSFKYNYESLRADQFLEKFYDPLLKEEHASKIYENITTEIEKLYGLNVVETNFLAMRTMFKQEKGGSFDITIVLHSEGPLSARKTIKYLSQREENSQDIRRILSPYLKGTKIVSRVSSAKSEYLFEMNNTLTVTLFISITNYTNEVYYETYGYFETAIESICQKRVSSARKIAKKLGVSIEGLSRDQICTDLWQAFWDLDDSNFEYFTGQK